MSEQLTPKSSTSLPTTASPAKPLSPAPGAPVRVAPRAVKVARALRGILSLDDFETAAARYLPGPIFAYVAGGCESDVSLRENRSVFDEYRLGTRILTNTSQRSLTTSLLGEQFAAPFGIAPMGISALSAYRGDLVQAQAAAQAKIPMIMSGSSLIRLEEIVEAYPDAWFQAYLPGEAERILALLERVEKAGYRTLVLTVDTPVSGNRENNLRAGFSTPIKPGLRLAWDGLSHPRWLCNTALRTLWRHGMPHFENSQAIRGAPILSASVLRDYGPRDHLEWPHFDLIRSRWHGRLIIKGILDPEDAALAKAHGADGIIVSNHGGRQLNGVVQPMHVLPSIIAAVGTEYAVMLDSGIRRGSDVLKALALGAHFVFVGRPINYAATIAGKPGVAHAVEILASEIKRNMALIGVNSPREMVTRKLYHATRPNGVAH